MDLSAFAALSPGPATTPQGGTSMLSVHDLGRLQVPSGQLEAADPFTLLGQGPVIEVPAGEHPVSVTVADVSETQDGSHLREAYLSIEFAPGAEVSREVVAEAGVSVDSGTVSFADHEAVVRLLPQDDEVLEELFDADRPDSWFSLLDSPEHLRAGTANITLPDAEHGENVILSHSGWGDGVYPVIRGLDERGQVVSLHIDLGVVGPVRELPGSTEVPQPTGPLTAHLLLDHRPAHLGEVMEASMPNRARTLTAEASTTAIFPISETAMVHLGLAGRLEDQALLRDASCSDDSAELGELITAHQGVVSLGPGPGDDPLTTVLSFVVQLSELPGVLAIWIPAQHLVLTPAQYTKDLDANVPLDFRIRPVEDADAPTVITRGFAALGGREVIFSEPDMPVTRMTLRLEGIVGEAGARSTRQLGELPQAGSSLRLLTTRYQLQPAPVQVDSADVLEMVAQTKEKRGFFERRRPS